MRKRFDKIASEPVRIPAHGIDRAVQIMDSSRLHRYGEDTSGASEVAELEREFAQEIGVDYAVAVNSCGCALFLALRACGVTPGDEVLCSAFTLAPVPGAIAHINAVPVFVDITQGLTVDPDDLRAKIRNSSARVLLLSHMRGHVAAMDEVAGICAANGIALIEDCAHTLGAFWKGRKVGSWGDISCFSAQTFKHVNAGEGGLMAVKSPDHAARIILMSGSYMFYGQHGARPGDDIFEKYRDTTPNFSMRMTNVAAALIRAQLPKLAGWRSKWNESYRLIESGLKGICGIRIVERDAYELYVGSSIQFCVEAPADGIETFIAAAGEQGVFLKWFGTAQAYGFTSRFDHWRYFETPKDLSTARGVLAGLIDMCIPLTLTSEDCQTIVEVIADAIGAVLCDEPLKKS